MQAHHRAVLLALGVWMGCQGRLFTIRIDEEASTTVQPGTLLEEVLVDFGFGDFLDMNLLDSTELQNQGVEPGDVKEVRLDRFELEAVSGDDLSFLSDLELYVEAPGLDRLLVAEAHDFEGQTLVELDLADVDLTAYVVSESMTFTTDVTGRRPSQTTEVVARFEVVVGVTGQGACNQIRGDEDTGG